MKDATGELSMTAVAVVAIAAIAALFGTLVWPQIKANIMNSTRCSQTSRCEANCTGQTCQCWYIGEDGKEAGPITCPNESYR